MALSAVALAARTCLHCGSPLSAATPSDFCCSGCAHVHALLGEEHLSRFYDLGGGRGAPVPEERVAPDRKWLEAVVANLTSQGPGLRRVDLDIQGVHCTACVWLLEELFRRRGGARIVVNPALGRVHLAIDGSFSLEAFTTEVERFGYRFGPALKVDDGRSRGLLARLGLCAALSMNAMILSIAIYAGLEDGPLRHLFHTLVFAISTACLLIGGSVFFRSAWEGLRRGVAHLDLPIALGLALAFGGSTYSFLLRQSEASYFDTLNVFVTLMLLGRFLQERVLEKNRRLLLADDGAAGLLTRRVAGGEVSLVRCSEVCAGDTLLLSPGDLSPVASVLHDREGRFSLDWITGESAACTFRAGDRIPAGAFAAGAKAVTVRAAEAFAASTLLDLLRSPTTRDQDTARTTPFWQRLSRVYVLAVLVAATVGFLLGLARGLGVHHALDIVVAVLVVTCPCAFGIATPMAYELVQGGLRRAGLYVRAAGFFDRAVSVRRVVFDKTGTLTTGRLVAKGDTRSLADGERTALYNMVVRSAHPKSVAVLQALATCGAPFVPGLDPIDRPGHGLELVRAGVRYRLGAPAWAAPLTDRARDDVVFSADGRILTTFTTSEELRADAAREIARLGAEGFEVWMLSGDQEERARAMAIASGIAPERTVFGQSPEGKAAWLAAKDAHDTLMIGDGINDSLVVGAAHCSGTPAIDRPFMPTRADFYFVTPGIQPIRLALAASRRLAAVTQRNLRIAVAYNIFAVALAYTGLMSPLVCAVFMPVSSISTLLVTTASLSRRSALWKS